MTAFAAHLLYLLADAIGRITSPDPAQYQRTCKRQALRPPDSGETNPHRDLERH